MHEFLFGLLFSATAAISGYFVGWIRGHKDTVRDFERAWNKNHKQ